MVSLHSEFNATSQVNLEVRDAISKSLELAIVNIDVNQHRAQSNSCDTFVYRTNDEIYGMGLEDLRAYIKNLHDGWKDPINREEEGIGLVCEHTISKHFIYSSLFIFNLDPHLCHFIDLTMKAPHVH